jgi:hypothetical protein
LKCGGDDDYWTTEITRCNLRFFYWGININLIEICFCFWINTIIITFTGFTSVTWCKISINQLLFYWLLAACFCFGFCAWAVTVHFQWLLRSEFIFFLNNKGMFKETKSFQTHKPIQPKPNTPLHTLPYLASQTDTQETGCVSKIPRERQKTRKNNNPYFLAKFLFIYLFLNTDTLHRWPERNIQLLENEPEARRDPVRSLYLYN